MTYEPAITVTAQGRKRVDLGRTTFLYGESHYLLTSVDLPIVSPIVEASEEAPCLALSLSHMNFIAGLAGGGSLLYGKSSAAMVTGAITPELLGACIRFMDLLDTPPDLSFLGGLIQCEIIYRILRGPEGARLRAIATLGDHSYRTAKALAWIRENYAKPLRLEDLAQVANMGVSTLHHHFRALTAISPPQYQKQLRLQAARGLMLLNDLDAASAAFAVGYASLSQFNREYSRLFGQPPMRDIRLLRSPTRSALGVAPQPSQRRLTEARSTGPILATSYLVPTNTNAGAGKQWRGRHATKGDSTDPNWSPLHACH